jgi:DNA-binding MarR family transcriptional regulator
VEEIRGAGFALPSGRILRVCDIFACVQTTSTSPEQLAEELHSLFRCVVRTQKGDVFRDAAASELSLSQVRALCLLDAADHEQALTELAPQLALSPAATGRALDALADAGLVSRRPDAIDRRVKRLAITDAGRELAARVTAARREALLRIAGSLEDDERDALSRALAPLLARTGAQR